MEIVENDKQYLTDFIRLNEEWISHYFQIERVDRELAKAPYKIVENGGYIFTLVGDDEVFGVCALFNLGNKEYELARMAVKPSRQGKGYGAMLMEHSLAKLRVIGAKKVILVSNTTLKNAIALYKKYGFVTTQEGPHPVYSRANIVMERTCC